MKKYVGTLLTLILVSAASVIGTAQEPEEIDMGQLMIDFSRVIDDPGMSASMMLIHLNDLTVDALFTAPAKYALRAQARQTSMFYVRGTANRNHYVEMEWHVVQGARNYRVTTTDLGNFDEETNERLSEGEQWQGIISVDTGMTLSLNQPWTVTNEDLVFQFIAPPTCTRDCRGFTNNAMDQLRETGYLAAQ